MTKSLSCAIVLVVSSSLSIAARAPLTFEERVKAQEAIERVYYNHSVDSDFHRFSMPYGEIPTHCCVDGE
jgi:hypothetical protein